MIENMAIIYHNGFGQRETSDKQLYFGNNRCQRLNGNSWMDVLTPAFFQAYQNQHLSFLMNVICMLQVLAEESAFHVDIAL